MQYDNVCLISHYDATEFASRTPDYHTPHHIYILSTFAFRPLQMKNNPRFPKRHAKCNANGIIYTPTCRTQSPWLINETQPVPPTLCQPSSSSTSSSSSPSPQPHPPKQQNNRRKEAKPSLPAHARLLGHDQHTIHSALDLEPRVLKLVIHLLCEGSRSTNLVADEMG